MPGEGAVDWVTHRTSGGANWRVGTTEGLEWGTRSPRPRLGFRISLWIENHPTLVTEETQVPPLRLG